MGLFRDIASIATGVPLSGGKRSSKTGGSNSSQVQSSDQEPENQYGEGYGQQTLRAVKRATRKRSNGNGNGRY